MDGNSSFVQVSNHVPDVCVGLPPAAKAELAAILGDVMRSCVTFQFLRRQVYDWMRVRGHSFCGVERKEGYLVVSYYFESAGALLVYTQPELLQYTKAQPVNTW